MSLGDKREIKGIYDGAVSHHIKNECFGLWKT